MQSLKIMNLKICLNNHTTNMKASRILTLIALAVLSAACAKEKEVAEEQAPIVPAGPNTVVFTAQAPSKTSIDSNDEVVSWVAGDEVRFSWDGGYAIAAASTSGASTTFSVEIAEGVDEIYAIYPASAGGSVNDGKVTVHYSGSRADGSFAANDISVAKAVKSGDEWDTSLAFKNAACILKVGVSSGSEITKLRVEAVGGEEIAGAFEVSMDGDGNPVAGDAVGTAGSMSAMTVSGPGNYYIPIKPGVTLSNGFRVSRFIGDEQTTPFYYNGEFTTVRGKIYKLDDIDAHAGHFYVTPDGAGTKSGQSWSNAMDAAGFKAFVENNEGNNFFIINGSTFHFSAEEFSFGDDYVKPSFTDHGAVAFTLEGTVTATDTTTFLGRTNTTDTGSNVKAGVLWPQASTYLTVKNVKFTGTNGASNASAIRLNNSAKELTLDHCYFRNNKTAGNGGSISLFNSATVTIKDCSFSDNIGGGAMIHVNHANAKVIIQDTEVKGITKNAIYGQSFDTFSVTRVTFKNSDDAGEWGAAAYISGSGTMTFTDCDFIGNHSTVAGGAVCVSGSSSVSFTGCNFTDNTCDKRGGAVMVENSPSATFSNCTFLRNSASNQGGAININGTGATTAFTDCEFTDNWSDYKGGAVMIESGNANTTFTGDKFQGNHADGADNTNAAGAAIYATGSGVVFDCTNVLFKSNYNAVGSNEFSGGVIRVEQNGGVARLNGCVFDGNYSYRPSGSANPACAAIVNSRTTTPLYYFNACEFKNNATGTYAGVGAKYGMLMAMYTAGTIAMNNCSVHDNYGGRNTDPIDWIYIDNDSATLLISNSSVIGDPMRKTSAGGSASVKNTNGVIYLSKDGNYYFINNILCSPTGKSLNCATSITIESSYYNKTSPVNGTCDWGSESGSGHDYYASSSSFGGWSAPFTWNGTLTGTNSDKIAETLDVNTEIQEANPDFYSWLNSIGALGKDINGKSRGEMSWPGCYQN